MMDIRTAYREIASISIEVCKTCEPPFHCCEKAGCDQAKWWTENVLGLPVKSDSNKELPFMSDRGCTLAPALRPLCAMWICASKEKQMPPRYFELRQEIVKAEAERFRGDAVNL